MKSNFSRPFRFNNWISTKQYQKKVTETKVEKIPNGKVKMAFFTPWYNIKLTFAIERREKKKLISYQVKIALQIHLLLYFVFVISEMLLTYICV